MKTGIIRLITIVGMALIMNGTNAQPIDTQTGAAPLPTIISFTSDVQSVSVEAAEQQRVYATLSWSAAGVPAEYNIALYRYHQGEWQTLSARLPSIGSQAVLVAHPLDFNPPTYRLTIFDPGWRVVDEQFITIPYSLTNISGLPTITQFFSATTSVDVNQLAQNQVQVLVAWSVVNRLPTTNIVFEQMLDDNRALNIELPRPNLWIPSSGNGALAPVLVPDNENLRIRMRIVDLRDNSVYGQQEIVIPVTGEYATFTPTPTATATPTATPTVTPGGDIGILPVGTPTPSG